MNDQAIVKVAEESCRLLSDMPWHPECNCLIPSYNGLLDAARANHPDEPFLTGLAKIEDGEANAPHLHIMFSQIRIAIESLSEDDGGAAS